MSTDLSIRGRDQPENLARERKGKTVQESHRAWKKNTWLAVAERASLMSGVNVNFALTHRDSRMKYFSREGPWPVSTMQSQEPARKQVGENNYESTVSFAGHPRLETTSKKHEVIADRWFQA